MPSLEAIFQKKKKAGKGPGPPALTAARILPLAADSTWFECLLSPCLFFRQNRAAGNQLPANLFQFRVMTQPSFSCLFHCSLRPHASQNKCVVANSRKSGHERVHGLHQLFPRRVHGFLESREFRFVGILKGLDAPF